VDTRQLRNESGASGQAFICVRPDGENSIVVASGANATVRSLTAEERVAIASARVLVVQLELPVEAVHEGLRAAREASTITVLNAAPARPLGRELLDLVDVLVVNVHEARTLAGALDTTDLAGAHPAELAARVSGTGAVVVTLGGQGALSLDSAGPLVVPALPARVVDTTGAGDTFTGVLAATLAEGVDLRQAVGRAVVAAALSVEKHGAVSSIPWRADIEARVRT
jgi:ribokinase